MSARARIDSMRPERPGRTRTADPKLPDLYWTRGRYLPYIAFGSCGLVIAAVAFGMLNAVWVLGAHDPAAWRALLDLYARIPMLVIHAFMLVALTGFEIMVSFLQAYIFTILAAVYIGGAMHPDH